MPRFTLDIREAAARCFHLNSDLPLPYYAVIRDDASSKFAVASPTILKDFNIQHPSSGLELAVYLKNEHLLKLMGLSANPDDAPTVLLFDDDSNDLHNQNPQKLEEPSGASSS